jgi:hypothetical protein
MGQAHGGAGVVIGGAGSIGSVVVEHPAAVAPIAVVTALQSDQTSDREVFVGRVDQVERLCALLAPADRMSAGAVVVAAVAGMGGVGKTALARYAGSLAVGRGWFKGGAAFVDLRGYDLDGSQIQPDRVFAPLLRALGVPGKQIPRMPSEQVVVYHQVLARLSERGQRVLVVLDNAATAEQVLDLLPRQWLHRGLVTTRDALTIPGARQLDLDVLTIDDACDMLESSLALRNPTDSRVVADPAAAMQLVKICGRLPLALEITAALLASEPALPLAEFVEELGDVETRLDILRHGDRAVAAAFDRSWQRLLNREPYAARLLRLLTVNPGPDISTEAAAALVEQAPSRVRTGLRVLRDAHLLQHTAGGRWRMHDLVRLYAHRQLTQYGDDDDLGSATTRLATYYRNVAYAANEHLRARPGQQVSDLFASREEAVAWLDAERASLTAVAFAVSAGRDALTSTLATCLAAYQAWRRRLIEQRTISKDSAAAVHRAEDSQRLAAAWNNVGGALLEVWRSDRSVTSGRRSLENIQATSDRNGEVEAWSNLGFALMAVGLLDVAISAHQQACEICEVDGDSRSEAEAYNNFGLALGNAKRYDEARTIGRRAADAFDAIGDARAKEKVERWLVDLPY